MVFSVSYRHNCRSGGHKQDTLMEFAGNDVDIQFVNVIDARDDLKLWNALLTLLFTE